MQARRRFSALNLGQKRLCFQLAPVRFIKVRPTLTGPALGWRRTRRKVAAGERRVMRTTTFTFFDYLPDALREIPKRRGAEALGLALAAVVAAGALALLSWSAADPSLNHATSAPVHNWLGKPGAVAADIAMQFFGIASALLLGAPAFWGWRLITKRRLDRFRLRLSLGLLSLASGAGSASLAPAPGSSSRLDKA